MSTQPDAPGDDRPEPEEVSMLSELVQEIERAPTDSGRGRLLELARATQQAVLDRLSAESLVVGISAELMNLPVQQIDLGLTRALRWLARAGGLGRAYIFLLTEDGTALADAYEWATEGVEAHDFDAFRGVSVDAFPWSMKQWLAGETVIVEEPNELPAEAAPERGACDSLGIRSYVNMPLFSERRLIGWLGYDAVDAPRRWSPRELSFMSIAAATMVSALARKRQDEIRMRECELRQRVMSISTLAAGIAHEINNPLTFVLGNLIVVREKLTQLAEQAALPGQQKLDEALRDAEDGVRRIEKTVADLRTLAQADETSESCDLRDVVESTLRMAWSQVRHVATIDTRIADDVTVRRSWAQVGQILLNLLLNALEAIEPGQADQNRIEIVVKREGDSVVLSVRDSGCGIPEDALPRVFDPFFTLRDVGEGMGIGLAITHRIVTSVGGTITAHSRPGEGSTFVVTLAHAPGEEAGGSRPRVLVVDDEPGMHRMLRRILDEYDVHCAHSGQEALGLLEDADSYDVILCDIMMPNVTGPQLCRAVAERTPELARRFVFMTGATLKGEPSDLGDLGCGPRPPVIHKPFTAVEIREALAEVNRTTGRSAPAR